MLSELKVGRATDSSKKEVWWDTLSGGVAKEELPFSQVGTWPMRGD
jgi:hypothetical protein